MRVFLSYLVITINLEHLGCFRFNCLLSDLVRTDRSGGSGGAGIGSDLSYAPSQGVPEKPASTPLGAPPMCAGTAPVAKSSKISSVKVAVRSCIVLMNT